VSQRTRTLCRFSELPPEADPQNVAALIRSAQTAPEDDMPGLRWRLHTSLYRAPRRRRLVWGVALVAVAVFVAGTVVGAMSGPFWARKSAGPDTAVADRAKPAAQRRSAIVSHAKPSPPEPEPVIETAPAEKPEAPATIRRPSLRRGHSSAEPVVMMASEPTEAPVSPPPSPIAVEEALLGDVVRTLRTQNDSRTALSLLDEHGRAFPQTALASEAAVLRVEALLGLGRSGEALSQLDGLPLASMPHGDAWLVLRGELRAVAGRWSDAGRDFDQAMTAPTPAARDARDLVERALWGRASARSRLGDEAGARADVSAYLQRFPTGRFAPQAAALLRGAP
jgi:hypothetical protein